jgi:DNA adenine methylase
MHTIIRWAGSKRQLLPKLKAYWPNDRRYIEPFCGSACLFFELEPRRAILGDLNGELVSTYATLKSDVAAVCDYIRALPNRKEAYYRIRNIDPEELNEIEKAARFLYLNKHCFNGIFRTNLRGQFNVPRGTRCAGFDYEEITKAAELLHRAKLVCGDFEKTTELVVEGDFVYLDPPYAVSERRIFAEYHPETFSLADLARLAKTLCDIHARGAMFVISYAESREAYDLLSPWKPRRVRTRRHIAGFAANRRHAYELIASNSEDFLYAA